MKKTIVMKKEMKKKTNILKFQINLVFVNGNILLVIMNI